MTAEQFVAKWSQIQQKETAVAQSHFNDICRLIDHPTPLEYDPDGQTFSFETQTVKPGGQKGFADVYFKGKFIWEYKGPHKDLAKAYQQLQLYREDLQNPPLLITSDIHTIVIHTNFNNYPTVRHTVTLDDIAQGDGVATLSRVFHQPEQFKPDRTQEQITRASADTFLKVANAMKQHRQLTGETYTPEQLAHFLVRLLFCLFAEDMKLLPENVFTQIVKVRGGNYADLQDVLRQLFNSMRSGGTFGWWRIRYFDGTLFDDDFVPHIPHDLGRALLQAAQQDWSQVDPSIFGTLFERIIDESKRAQLGAHYTSESDIMLIVEPVLMEPLRRQWDDVRRQADRLLRQPSNQQTTDAYQLLADFAAEIAAMRVLDPACGSGNFLYVALRQLLDLQKQVIAFAARRELPEIALTVSPEQLYGIEINPYAHELAQVTVWIGYLQWRHENGFGEMDDPILRPLHNIERRDAILDYDADGRPIEPEWPSAEVIIGNPPFLGGNKIRQELGDETVDQLFQAHDGRVPKTADLVVYWFARSWTQITKNRAERVGLIATQAIRSAVNRSVLDKISESNGLFLAWSDKPWVLDGAAVRVSIIGFDGGSQKEKRLDGDKVERINADLTSSADLTKAARLIENIDLTFQGSMIGGSFQISESTAKDWLELTNPSGKDNSDVVRPYVTGIDVLRRTQREWIVDFGAQMPEEEASQYEMPFQYLQEHVYPVRAKNRRASRRERWWIHADPQPSMRVSVATLSRYIATVRVAKHRLFVWLPSATLCSNKLIVIARSDDYFFGVLHSNVHEVWSLVSSSRHGVGNDPAYTPTSTFETYPFPWPPGQEPAEADDERVAEIAHWARELVAWRDAWLNPPPPQPGAINVAYDKMLKQRTLTNLYNGLVYYRETVKAGKLFMQDEFDKVTRRSVSRSAIQELDDIHTALDHAVLDAYGWPHDLSDEAILEQLLALNLERAANQ
ncbi:MAG: class I SAM-dependent DNA methyltransferase [Anaerolineae bacterium]|nr:class I SAM-dependent DNA methyltransferase [Anaerolineae bacterium]MCO5204670.1 class I SAM-dependent DNA methyltransferase [Anaerolineae bacterium]